jgi:antirestriction protein
MYFDPTEIRDEYLEIVEELGPRFDELAEFVENDSPLTPSDFKEYELLQEYFECGDPIAEYKLPDENSINHSSDAYNVWVQLERLDRIHGFCSEVGTTIDDPYAWDDMGPLIAECDFAEYAEDFACDIGAVNEDNSWPNSYIDWERAARDLAMDYSMVDWEGTSYYVRQF